MPHWMVVAAAGLCAALCAFDLPAQDEPADAAAPADLIDFNPPPELELNLLIQMVSDELDLKILYDEKVGSQRVRLLVPTQIPKDSMRGILESALRMKGFALVEGDEPGWLEVVEARNLLNIAPGPAGEGEGDPAEAPVTAAVTRVFRLEHADAQRTEQVVRPYLTEPGGNLQAVAEQRLLIVTDYAPRVARIAEVLKLIDRPAREVSVRFHAVVNLEAREAADELTRILQARRRATGDGGAANEALPLEIVQQARTNQLVLIGEEAQLDEAVELLESIDIDLGLETRLYSFSVASPSRVDTLVQNLIDPGLKTRLYRSSADEENGLLVVTTTPAVHAQVASVRDDLDREIDASRPVVRYYKLANAKAGEVLTTISGLEGGAGYTLIPSAGNARSDGGAGARDPRSTGPADPQRNPGALAGIVRVEPRGEGEDGQASPPGNANAQTGTASGDRVPLSPSVQTEDATLIADTNTNTIIVLAEEARHAFYLDLIQQLDKRRPQVMIEVTLVALSTSDGKSVGVEISRTGDADDEPRVLSFSSFGLTDSTDPADLLAASGLGFNGVILSEDIANVVIRALKTDGDTEVISAPKILVNDNASGTLASVTDAPFTTISSLSDSDAVGFGGFESAGTNITVTPQISEGDHLKLTYSIELSTFGEGGSDTTPPPRQRQTINSEVTVPDGQTVVVGGLKRNDWTNTVSRVPILGEIPILEYLFSSRSSNEAEATLFVFIRPVVLRDDDFADLKYLSGRDMDTAGLPGDFPKSEPLLMQ